MKISRIKKVEGELRVPSDKSITHRGILLGTIGNGKTLLREWLDSADTRSTLSIVKMLGVNVEEKGRELLIEGRKGVFKEPADILDAGNSGTTARLTIGLLSTQPFFSVITGDESLRNRPMLRVVKPLREMGATIDGREGGNRLPVAIRGGNLKGISFFNKKSSAQVKSSLMIAGLFAEGITEITEPFMSRDHTERMLKYMGVEVVQMETEKGHIIKVRGGQIPNGEEIYCPADPSSSAFFAGLATLLEGSEILLKDVLVNPTRDGFFRILKRMGGKIEYINVREISGETVADILVKSADKLEPVTIKGDILPSLIDEIPILAIVMAFADGVSCVRQAEELRVKESDRIRAVVTNLRRMGVNVEEFDDGFCIEGKGKLQGALINTYGDHRIAMAFTVAGLVAEGETHIDNAECVKVSYPRFYDDLNIIVRNGNI